MDLELTHYPQRVLQLEQGQKIWGMGHSPKNAPYLQKHPGVFLSDSVTPSYLTKFIDKKFRQMTKKLAQKLCWLLSNLMQLIC